MPDWYSPRPQDVRKLREQMELTQAAFGHLVYRSERIVQDWEAGVRQCPADTWELLHLLHELPSVRRWREKFQRRPKPRGGWQGSHSRK